MLLDSQLKTNHCTVMVPMNSELCQRVAMGLVLTASRFESDILLSAGSLYVDGKSPRMVFMMLKAMKGQSLMIRVSGPDSEQALEVLASLFQMK
jgi:phosphotransferase system HPr (HPr) family protein